MQFVHIYTRSGKAPSVSWESHYVGSIRGIRASHLDGFLLKSLDFINLPASHFIDPEGMLITPCGSGWPDTPQQRCIFRLSNKGKIVQLGSTPSLHTLSDCSFAIADVSVALHTVVRSEIMWCCNGCFASGRPVE